MKGYFGWSPRGDLAIFGTNTRELHSEILSEEDEPPKPHPTPLGKSRVIAKRQYSDSGIILKSKSPIFE